MPLLEETLKLTKAIARADHPDTLTSMNNLAMGYNRRQAGLGPAALGGNPETHEGQTGADHPETLTSMNNLAVGYRSAGKLELALPLCEETLKIRKAKLGPTTPIR